MGHGGDGDGTLFIKFVLEHLTKKRLSPTVLFKEMTVTNSCCSKFTLGELQCPNCFQFMKGSKGAVIGKPIILLPCYQIESSCQYFPPPFSQSSK